MLTTRPPKPLYDGISHTFLFRKRNVSDKFYGENQISYFILRNNFFYENNFFCELMWKNAIELDRPLMVVYYGACALYAG